MAPSKTYSAEAMKEILAIAAARQPDDAFTSQQLQEMAAELNISQEVLERAKQDWQRQQQQRTFEAKRRQRFRQQLVIYVVVNAGLILLDIASSGSITWAIYPLLGWGAGLLLEGGNACGSTAKSLAVR